jgi:ribosomal-protein-alanine N-acetyltransferase
MEAKVSNITKQQLDVQIRWLIRRDMPEVLQIERNSFATAWSDEDFLCCLRQRNCIGMVAEANHQIVGFMIYELHKAKLHILNFAVAPEFRRHGVGKQMVLRLIDKLSQQRRNEILLDLRESNLEGQLFFRTQGFRAVKVVRCHYDDTAEDAYIMQFRLDRMSDEMAPYIPQNRISDIEEAA